MLNFCQFYNLLNGEPYHDVPPPVHYKLANMDVTQSALNNVEGESSYELRPLAHEDMCRYAADDVAAHYHQLHKGKNPCRLGKPMTDGEFKKFLGQTW